MKTISPSSTMIFARVKKAEEKTASGIFLGKSVERESLAEVINIGSEVRNCKSGDFIVYKEHGAHGVKVNGEDFLLVDDEHVLGVLVDVV